MKMTNKDDPLVSVIMPVYNSEKYLIEAIESILNQTLKDFEFIIVDDCSTDSSSELIERYATADKRTRILRNDTNLNIAKARNRGLEVALGKYIATMDSDDRALPTRLEDQVGYLETHLDVAISIGNINVISENGVYQYMRPYPITDRAIRSKVYRYNPFPNPTIMCRREVYEKTGTYDDKYVPIDDFDFWIRAGVNFKFGNCNRVVLDYRVRNGSSSHARLWKTEKLTFKLRAKALKLGYKVKVADLLLNFFHLVTFLFLPHKIKVLAFNFLRRYNILG